MKENEASFAPFVYSADYSDEKFSADCAARVFSVLCRRSKCTVRAICEETGISKMTAGRVMARFEKEKLVRKYPYRSIFTRGVKPAEYYLDPRTSAAVLDLRANELNLYVYSVPKLKETVISPKILSARPMSDKIALLREDCFGVLGKRVPEKYLLSLSVLTDEVSVKPGDFPERTEEAIPEKYRPTAFRFTSEELEASFFGERAPGKKILYVRLTDERREALLFKDGEILSSSDISGRIGMRSALDRIASCVSQLAGELCPDEVRVFSPFVWTALKGAIGEKCSDIGVPVAFLDENGLDLRIEAVKMTMCRRETASMNLKKEVTV